jgi:hypothetical protein
LTKELLFGSFYAGGGGGGGKHPLGFCYVIERVELHMSCNFYDFPIGFDEVKEFKKLIFRWSPSREKKVF